MDRGSDERWKAIKSFQIPTISTTSRDWMLSVMRWKRNMCLYQHQPLELENFSISDICKDPVLFFLSLWFALENLNTLVTCSGSSSSWRSPTEMLVVVPYNWAVSHDDWTKSMTAKYIHWWKLWCGWNLWKKMLNSCCFFFFFSVDFYFELNLNWPKSGALETGEEHWGLIVIPYIKHLYINKLREERNMWVGWKCVFPAGSTLSS